MNTLRQWLRQRRKDFTAWLLRLALKLLARLSAEAIQELPWQELGKRLNEATDARFTAKVADQVQRALADGLEQAARGLRA